MFSTEANMETTESCVENGKLEENCDTAEQQYDANKQNLSSHEELDDKSINFEAHFNGNGLGSDDDYDENDDRSFDHR